MMVKNNEYNLARHGYELKNQPSDYEKRPIIDREEKVLLKNETNY